MKIGIDAGHGWPEVANKGPTGYVEAEGVLDIAHACRTELQNNGVLVFMTRTGKDGLTLRQRADKLNAADVDLIVSIHTNACNTSSVRGVETIYSIHGGVGKELALVLLEQLHQDLNVPKRRMFCRKSETHEGKDYYYIIRCTKKPCVIVEVEFHSNPEAETLLKESDFRIRAGRSIARGILKFAGVEVV